MGPSRNSVRRFAWKKFAIGAAVLIGLVYFFGPRKEDLDDYMPCESPMCMFIFIRIHRVPHVLWNTEEE